MNKETMSEPAAVRKGFYAPQKIRHIEPSGVCPVVYVEFEDGAAGTADLTPIAWKSAINRDFANVRLDHGIPVWDNDWHVSPDWIRSIMRPMSKTDWEKSKVLALAGTANYV